MIITPAAAPSFFTAYGWKQTQLQWELPPTDEDSAPSDAAGSDAVVFPHHVRRGDERGEEMNGDVPAEHHRGRQLRQTETEITATTQVYFEPIKPGQEHV